MLAPEGNPFLTVAATILVMSLVLAHELAPVAKAQPGLAIIAAFGAVVPAIVAVARPSALGCGALVASIALYAFSRALGQPPLQAVALFLTPGWIALLWEHGVVPVLARLAAKRALEAVGAVQTPEEVAPFLAHEARAVRELAARRLGAGFSPASSFPLVKVALESTSAPEREAAYAAMRTLAQHPDGRAPVHELLRERSRQRDDALAAEAARSVAQLDLRSDLMATEAPAEERPRVRLAYAEGLLAASAASDGTGSRASLAATLLTQVLGDPDVADDLRAQAVEAMDRIPGREVRAAAAPLLVRDEVTAELLWLFVEHGQPEDTPLLARWVAVDDHAVCNAAVEALEATKARGGELGPAVRTTLEAGKTRVRGVHPPGDNPLADSLVQRIEGLLA